MSGRKKTIFMVMAALCLHLTLSAQNVSLRLSSVAVKEAMEALKREYGYSFVFASDDVDTKKVISVDVQDKPVGEAVRQILQGQENISYEISNKSIVVSRKVQRGEAAARKKISGVIRDEAGETVGGASVLIKGSRMGVATDIEGRFSIDAPAGSTLVVSHMGYATKEVEAGESANLQIVIQEDQQQLDDVVVIGYGVQNKRDVSTSISSIKSQELVNVPISDFRQAMVGKMPGVQILQSGGGPEGNVSIRVRGVSSATAGNDPLYVVDGVPMERGFSNFNNNDIESIEVLKDASSAAIYGSRGSNGVILITTKQGRSEKLTVSYDGYYGVSQVSKRLPMMDAYQFAEAARDGHNSAYMDEVPTGSPDDPNSSRPQSYHKIPEELFPYLNGEPGLTNTDWQNAIFRRASTTSHNVSLAGKGSNLGYFVSGNYTKNEGVIIASDFEKYSMRLNLNGNYDKLKFGVNFAPSYSASNRVKADGAYGSGGIVQSALAMPPVWPVYNADGSYNFQGNGYWRVGNDYQHNEVLNPVALARLQSDVVDRYAIVGKVFGEYEFFKGFSYNVSLGYDFYGAHNDKYRSSELPRIGYANYANTNKAGNTEGYSSSSFYLSWLIENKLTYSTRIGDDHSISAVLVQSAQKETLRSNSVTATSYPNDHIQTISGGTVSTGSSDKAQWSLASYLARAQYSYQGKYMFSAALRADGSSRFGKNNRWGYFPSASAAWRVSDENFFSSIDALNFVSDFKLRASYGATGNFQIGNYEHLSTMSSDDYILGGGDGALAPGYKPDKVKNDDLSWEKTSMVNAGFDLQVLRGLLGLTVEYYYSNTTDMLLSVPVPHLTGHSEARMNIGKVNNRGVEISLSSQRSITKDLQYSLSANFSKNINEVKALGAGDAPIIKSGSVEHAYYITQVGQPIGSYYLLVQDGIFKNEEELKMYPHFANTQPGDFRFVDVDGNGVLDQMSDRTVVGNYMPDFTYGWSGTLSYRWLDLGFAFQGVYGNEILNLNRRYIDNMEGNVNGTTVALDRWRSPENPGNGEVNRANRKTKGSNGRTSTWHIEDGSYLRLQNVTLGYTLPEKATKRIRIDKMRVYASGQNLLTWTKYTGYNPEVNLRPGDALTPGEDYGTYPLARVFTVGLNLTF